MAYTGLDISDVLTLKFAVWWLRRSKRHVALHLTSKSCRSHSQLKAFRSAIASLKLKAKQLHPSRIILALPFMPCLRNAWRLLHGFYPQPI